MKEFDLLLKNVGIKNAILQDVLEIAIVLIAIILILAIIRENMIAFKRAGADIIITYHAKEILENKIL